MPHAIYRQSFTVNDCILELTLPKTKMDPENGTQKDCFALQTSGFHGPYLYSIGYTSPVETFLCTAYRSWDAPFNTGHWFSKDTQTTGCYVSNPHNSQ